MVCGTAAPRCRRAPHGMVQLSARVARCVVIREFDLAAKRFSMVGLFLPEAKGGRAAPGSDRQHDTCYRASWAGEAVPDNVGLRRNVRSWHRGTQFERRRSVFACERAIGGAGCGTSQPEP